jgi:SAM-dependent methyltransferase
MAHEFVYSANPASSGWNTPAVDAEILAYLCELISESGTNPSAEMVELGCGKGNLTLPLAEMGFSITGVDISPTALKAAEIRAASCDSQARFILADVTLPDFHKLFSGIDCVVDGLCLHCIIGPDRNTVLNSAWEMLRPGGVFLVITMCGNPRASALRARFDCESRCIVDGEIADRYLGIGETLLAELKDAGFDIAYHRFVQGSYQSGDQDMLLAVGVRKQ